MVQSIHLKKWQAIASQQALRYTGPPDDKVTAPRVRAVRHPAQKNKRAETVLIGAAQDQCSQAFALPMKEILPHINSQSLASQVDRILGTPQIKERGGKKDPWLQSNKKGYKKIAYRRDNAHLWAVTGAEIPATLRATKNTWHVFHTIVYQTPRGSISKYLKGVRILQG